MSVRPLFVSLCGLYLRVVLVFTGLCSVIGVLKVGSWCIRTCHAWRAVPDSQKRTCGRRLQIVHCRRRCRGRRHTAQMKAGCVSFALRLASSVAWSSCVEACGGQHPTDLPRLQLRWESPLVQCALTQRSTTRDAQTSTEHTPTLCDARRKRKTLGVNTAKTTLKLNCLTTPVARTPIHVQCWPRPLPPFRCKHAVQTQDEDPRGAGNRQSNKKKR